MSLFRETYPDIAAAGSLEKLLAERLKDFPATWASRGYAEQAEAALDGRKVYLRTKKDRLRVFEARFQQSERLVLYLRTSSLDQVLETMRLWLVSRLEPDRMQADVPGLRGFTLESPNLIVELRAGEAALRIETHESFEDIPEFDTNCFGRAVIGGRDIILGYNFLERWQAGLLRAISDLPEHTTQPKDQQGHFCISLAEVSARWLVAMPVKNARRLQCITPDSRVGSVCEFTLTGADCEQWRAQLGSIQYDTFSMMHI